MNDKPSFDDSMFAAADQYTHKAFIDYDPREAINSGADFIKGARWSREQTLKEVVEFLEVDFKTTDNSAACWYAKKIKEKFGVKE